MKGKIIEMKNNKETYKIVLVLNKDTRQRVLDEKYNKEIYMDKCVMERGLNLKIVYRDGSFFTHEEVEYIGPFDEYGLKIVTTKKEWYIY